MARTAKRRKPRRKRLIVNAIQESDIPYSKCRIEWIDIVSDSGWASDKEFNRMKLASPVNEGWVYSKDKERAIAIYNSIRTYASDNNGKPIVCPNCKAQRSEPYYNSKGIFYKLFPFFEKRKYKCLNCNMITNSK